MISTLASQLEKYLKFRTGEGLTKEYIQNQRSALLRFIEYCWEKDIDRAEKIDSKAILGYMKSINLFSASYQRSSWTFIRHFLSYYENYVAIQLKIKIRGDSRLRVDWLTEEEIDRIWLTPKTEDQAFLLSAGILMGLRRVEMLRITAGDARKGLKEGRIRILGKNRKQRTIPLQRDFARILRSYLSLRGDISDEERLFPYQRSTANNILKRFCQIYGKNFSFHTLRRSHGRLLFLRGVEIEIIAHILGHESIDQTKDYIGINLTDMEKALSMIRIKEEIVTVEKMKNQLTK